MKEGNLVFGVGRGWGVYFEYGIIEGMLPLKIKILKQRKEWKPKVIYVSERDIILAKGLVE